MNGKLMVLPVFLALVWAAAFPAAKAEAIPTAGMNSRVDLDDSIKAGLLLAKNEQGGEKKNGEPDREKEKPLPPEKYYQLALERQELLISSYKHMIKILEFHEKQPAAARKDLQTHEKEKKQKLRALFEKYGTTPSDYYRSWRGTDELEKRSRYLDDHPDLRDKLAENSSRIRKLEEKVWKLLRPIYRSVEK